MAPFLLDADASAVGSIEPAPVPATQVGFCPNGWARFAVIRVPVLDKEFRPRKVGTPLSSMMPGMPRDVLEPIARHYNASEFAQKKSRWAVVLASCGIVELHDIPAEERPERLSGLPYLVRDGLLKSEALEAVEELNGPILKVSRVPRVWHLAVLEPWTERPAAVSAEPVTVEPQPANGTAFIVTASAGSEAETK